MDDATRTLTKRQCTSEDAKLTRTQSKCHRRHREAHMHPSQRDADPSFRDRSRPPKGGAHATRTFFPNLYDRRLSANAMSSEAPSMQAAAGTPFSGASDSEDGVEVVGGGGPRRGTALFRKPLPMSTAASGDTPALEAGRPTRHDEQCV